MTSRAGTVLDSVSGAVLIAANLATSAPLRRWRTAWGATDDERKATLPGDELVPDADWTYTHEVTVHAPPDAVWRWIVQIGQGRGGFYSYQGLENLIGCRIRNTDRILDDFQHLQVGDVVAMHPSAPGLPVVAIETNSRLVLHNGSAETGDSALWSFHVVPGPGAATRLLERGRYAHGPTLASRLGFGPTLLEPISFVMCRKMLLGIRDLAERGGRPFRASRRSRRGRSRRSRAAGSRRPATARR
ncbi:hypothetical protein ACFYVR_08300 [Rhodococcus sp. NPDC003318]|uniref:hypothetical protein n=1 Tax=Rhodococcus sp. NPDC003318 TaxID=3364503 RepID=UPI0036B30AFD